MISINNLRTSASYYRASWFFKKYHSSATDAVVPLEFHLKPSIPSRWALELGWPGWGSWPEAGWPLPWGQRGQRGQRDCQDNQGQLLTPGTAVQGPGHKGEQEEPPKNQTWSLLGSAPGRKCVGSCWTLSTKIHQWRPCYVFYLRNRGKTQRQFWKTSSCSLSLQTYTQVF